LQPALATQSLFAVARVPDQANPDEQLLGLGYEAGGVQDDVAA